MSASRLNGNVARKLLIIQLLTIIVAGLLFCLNGPFWGASAVFGGLAVWLPNVVFMFFAWRHKAHSPTAGRIAWSFALGEAAKVVATFSLLVVALAYVKAVFLPLIVTWISALVVQMLAPAVINNKG
ncbi:MULTISPECIES: F0F1 ATP synthase subunit I [Tenebrionibacter/Tenebrionicola group]|jgi:ATP synthase protein I|uniref:F0F1 ATP synthase subunit I n=2 Tax=Tenebrionibacter/Tenebrionicola group TaxID=2969848 RepID=A0A8K0V340_9ENTR|nr:MULTISPECIES: F0F1 ATP synthase subunit I [Tenebrionibacter/Tenebrionicola group]MBK4714305.1 F0F1 ATP synthase subunit I [Tenebrionibacter intestinalis]MBV5095288.1 F0F1 ATP synthase subunit I [Tenebrionicola larvae]